MKEAVTESDLELLNKLNLRAMKIVAIENSFQKKKVQIDTAYLDSLSDAKIDEIYKNHVNV